MNNKTFFRSVGFPKIHRKLHWRVHQACGRSCWQVVARGGRGNVHQRLHAFLLFDC